MARRLRISFADAMYHVINRGNYRADVFASDGAVKSFLAALDEACRRYQWRVHAYVVMRNHYHLALQTPRPNLSEGMHWLQSTFATRFNRFRQERGHLFQARYQAIVAEGDEALLALCDYIHLNPARARVVTAARLLEFPRSSLTCFVRGPRAPWLVCDGWLERAHVSDSPEGWRCYFERLVTLAGDPLEQRRRGFHEMSRGWAIGTHGWRTAVAKQFAQHALTPGLVEEERRGLLEAQWEGLLAAELQALRQTHADLNAAPGAVTWKIALAYQLRRTGSVPYRWLATRLGLGNPESARVAVRRYALRVPA